MLDVDGSAQTGCSVRNTQLMVMVDKEEDMGIACIEYVETDC